MSTKRIGCVARRIVEKMDISLADLSVEVLAMHIYGDASGCHLRDIRRTLLTMRYPEGWSVVLGKNMRAVRNSRRKLRYFGHGRKA